MLPFQPAEPIRGRHPRRKRIGQFGRAAAVAVVAAALTTPTAAFAADLAPQKYDVEPDGSGVLISEIAAGGAGATPQANRNANQNFIELTNYGDAAVDLSGWKIFRCGQTGGGYGPQTVIADGTVLQPGDQFTTAAASSSYEVDASYETSLHSFGFGAFIEDASGQRLDAIGFYHEDVSTDCATASGEWSQNTLQHRLDESHQRVDNTGDIDKDWVVAPRTVDAPNATEWDVPRVDNGLRITELSNSGAVTSADQYVEITNFGDAAVNVGGYQYFRCGDNGSQYLMNGNLPDAEIQPGESFLISHSGATDEAIKANSDATFSSGMHHLNYGAIIYTPNEEIVDRVAVYGNRNSPCMDTRPLATQPNAFHGEVVVRVDDTGDNSVDFSLTTTRTPGEHDANPAVTASAVSEFTDIKISELTGAGPKGGNDEFVELANYGTETVNLSGWTAYRCYGTGQPGIGSNAQVADLGNVDLAPGETYLMVASGAPAELRDIADATYSTGLNQTDGFGMYITDGTGAKVDAVAVYDVNQDVYTPCREGEEVRNYVKNDQGESITRAQDTGDNELDFQIVADRTPGELIDALLIDPTQPLDGELDPVEVDTNHVPGTPTAALDDTGFNASVTVRDEDGTTVSMSAFQAEKRDEAGVKVYAGTTNEAIPASREIDGEAEIDTAQALETVGTGGEFPFQRFEVPVTEGASGEQFLWSGTAASRNEIQLLSWNTETSVWEILTTAVPSADGDVSLIAEIPASASNGGTANLLVIDGPRTDGGLIDEIGVTDQAFANPGSYDFALNHMTDTQFYSEGYRDVFREMATWVVANADDRKIAYNSLTGDIIENWINGNNSPERAEREYAAAAEIMSYINDAGIPNGVLPGNHDNKWGYDNEMYNEYFPVDMYSSKDWYGESWREGDNSAHTDFFSHEGVDFMVISLQYRPSMEQMEWASEQAASHPDHNVIIATHSYLHTSDVRDSTELRYTGNADDIWEYVIAPNDNVFLVFGGHYHGISTQYADPVTGEQVDATEIADATYAHTNVGATGRTVVEMLADYQGYRSTQVDGNPNATRDDLLDRDTGFQRLLQFDLDASLMAINTYSPHLDSFEAWKYDEPAFRGDAARYDETDEEFVANISLVRNTTLSSTGWAVTGAPTEVASVTDAAIGEALEVALTAGETDQVWYATATDADGNSVATKPLALTAEGAEEPTDPEPTDPEPGEGDEDSNGSADSSGDDGAEGDDGASGNDSTSGSAAANGDATGDDAAANDSTNASGSAEGEQTPVPTTPSEAEASVGAGAGAADDGEDEASANDASRDDGGLAQTGANATVPLFVAGALIALGLAVLVIRRKRQDLEV